MDLFDYGITANYLRAYIESLPRKGRGEISAIAKSLGVTTSLVSQVLSESKVFTPEQNQELIRHLGLAGLEAEYLTYLNQLERAGSHELKAFWQEKLDEIKDKHLKLSSRVKVDKTLSEEQKAIYYSAYIYSAVRLYLSTGQDGKSLDEICNRFYLPRVEATQILQFLKGSGLCIEKENKYVRAFQKMHLEQGSPHLLKHYSNWRLKAIQKSERLTKNELMYTGTVSLSKKDFQKLREDMARFIRKFLDEVHASPAEDIACLNMDFFWIEK